jgi:uncharacterized protein YsxB (DUF464 family)
LANGQLILTIVALQRTGHSESQDDIICLSISPQAWVLALRLTVISLKQREYDNDGDDAAFVRGGPGWAGIRRSWTRYPFLFPFFQDAVCASASSFYPYVYLLVRRARTPKRGGWGVRSGSHWHRVLLFSSFYDTKYACRTRVPFYQQKKSRLFNLLYDQEMELNYVVSIEWEDKRDMMMMFVVVRLDTSESENNMDVERAVIIERALHRIHNS